MLKSPIRYAKFIPVGAMLFAVILGLSLAYWQIKRAWKKEAIEVVYQVREKMAPIHLDASFFTSKKQPDITYRRVRLEGYWLKDWPIYLDNRPMNGNAGMYVLMPFKLNHVNQYALVVRGWIPRSIKKRTLIQPYATPIGLVKIEARIKPHMSHILSLGQEAPLKPHALVANLDLDMFAKVSGLPVFPQVLEQISPSEAGLRKDWLKPSSGADRHRAYAMQWLFLAITAFLFFLLTRSKKQNDKNES